MTPFRLWSSPLTPDRVASGASLLAEPRATYDAFYWLQSLPEDGGRVAVMRLSDQGMVEVVIPAPWNVRSRVNEYGGGAYTVGNGQVWFVNDDDQALCRTRGDGVEQVAQMRGTALGDLEWDPVRGRVLAVAEDRFSGCQRIVAVNGNGTLEPLVQGADFYAAPRLSPDGLHLAWLEWSEPDMPWDSTRLMQSRFRETGRLGEMRQLAGGARESLCQPEWSPEGVLHVVSDGLNGFWNLCRVTVNGLVAIRLAAAECARPAFVFGQRLYAFTPAGGLLLGELAQGLGRCLEGAVDGTGMRERLPGLTEVAGIYAAGAGTIVAAGGAAEPLGIYVRWHDQSAFRRVTTSMELDLAPGYVSRPEPFEFMSGAGGGLAHAVYFPPAHPSEPPCACPPLRLRCHGGPTASASSALDPKTLYWTSRGFAVVEVNYRGSTGYGRAYREALYGNWGVADVEDACAAALALVGQRRCDPTRMIVAGSSAGGFTALHALCGDSPFAAGAVSYGVADLTALAEMSLRFEAHYGEKLIGPWPAARALYEARSPLHCAARISRPTIFFQGADDPVVPPAQSERMANALAARGVMVAYEIFAGERHGFRQPATVARTLSAELAFHCRVLALVSPDALPVVPLLSTPTCGGNRALHQ